MPGRTFVSALENHPILLVDDHSDVKEAMRAVLEAHDYAVVSAGDGLEALALLRRGLRPSLIILDLMMPGMNGWEFRAEQMRDPELAAIPTIVYSAGYSAERVAREMGATAGFRKGDDLNEMLKLVAAVCSPADTRS
jgi:CheY-like chemotaxis protein